MTLPPKAPKAKTTMPPMTWDELRILVEVRLAFRALAPSSTLIPVTGKGNRYELYTYLCIAENIKAVTPRFAIKNPGGGTSFRFKCRPTAVSDDYSFCAFHINTRDYELRNGIEYDGHQMRHEVDVAISTPLTHGAYALPSQLRFAVECKYFADLNGLKGQLRGLVGGILDLSPYDAVRKDCLLIGGGFQSHFACQHHYHRRFDFLDYLTSYNVAPLFDFHPAGKDMRAARQLIRDFCRILW